MRMVGLSIHRPHARAYHANRVGNDVEELPGVVEKTWSVMSQGKGKWRRWAEEDERKFVSDTGL
jgi:hypothetical protein